MERPHRKLPTIAALSAPLVLMYAACGSDGKNSAGQPKGDIKGAASNPTIGRNIETIAPPTLIPSVPGEELSSGEQVSIDGLVTIDNIIGTLDTLEPSLPHNTYESLINRFQGIKTLNKINPNDQQIARDLNQAALALDASCDIPGVKKLKTETALYMSQNFPQDYQNVIGVWEMGGCAVEPQSDELAVAPNTETIRNTHNTITVKSDRHEYELYTDVTIDEIINTANSLPQSSSKPKIVENLQSMKKVLEKTPGTTVYLFLIGNALNQNVANCQGDTSKELTIQIASWVRQKHPQLYEKSSQMFEQGQCSVLEKGAELASNSQDVTPITDLASHLLFRTNKYNYSLYPADKLTPPDFDFDSELALGIAFKNSPDVLNQFRNKTQEIVRLRTNNKNDPGQLPILNDLLSLITTEVCTSNFATKGYVKGIASIEYQLDPKTWPQKVDKYLNHPCFHGELYTP